MYRLVIFDLDGTLLNTLDDLAATGNYTLEALGYPTHPIAAYRRFIGNGIPNLVHRMLPEGHTDEQHEQCYKLYQERYSAHKADLTAPYKGMTELVSELHRRGVICCVNTNKAHEFAKELIQRFFGDSIKTVIGQGEGFPLKPSPDAALELCRRYDIPTESALYVGDSNVDMQTAAAAGIDACGVLWGFRDREELEGCKPAHIAEDAAALMRIIER